jgi:pimeloyl-ACP methyl ester carboxylesterase
MKKTISPWILSGLLAPWVAMAAIGCVSPGSEPGEPVDDAMTEEVPVDPTAIRPFEIAVPEAVLDDLRLRLDQTRLPDQLDGVGWDYGAERGYVTELISYWREQFDWREQERRLNAFDQYKTVLGDLDIHFIHQRSPEANALPLIITHGWPGSIAEFTKIIGPLTDPVAHGGRAEDAFHVVAPSMPGYGFSDKPREPGFGPEQIADVGAQLMARLGYERYGIQGGDWGAIVSAWHAFKHPEQAVGLHSTMLIAGPPAGVDDPTAGVPPEELERTQARQAFYNTAEAGYSSIQGTKPQTVGYALNDSPAGQAAWIVEKFRAWCDCDGDPESIFTKDELLTNIMIYWVTQTATSSARLYYESRNAPPSRRMGRVEVPTGVAVFPYELFISPRPWAEAQYNITHWTEMPRGGHFAALEQPELLVDDLRTFFGSLRADLAP